MPNQDYRLVGVNSNIDRLSVDAVRDLFEDMIYRVAHEGEDWLRLTVPRGQTLELERNVGVSGPHSEGDLIEAAVGIPPIKSADKPRSLSPGAQNSGDYPLFVDRGTGLFGPAHAPIHARDMGFMKWTDAASGNPMFARETKGQPAKHFMLDTFEQMTRISLPIEAERFGERVKHLYAVPAPSMEMSSV